MINTLKVGDKVKVKEKHWSKKYIGTIKKITSNKKNKKQRLFSIQLDNKKYKSNSCNDK